MKRTIVIVVVLVAAIVAVVFIVEWHKDHPANSSLATMPVSEQTAQQNPAFASALQFEQQGKLASAIPQLQSALSSDTDQWQDLTIMFHLENDYSLTGAYKDAVSVLQKIAANGAYSPVTRSYAVETMGVIYLDYPDPNIATEIFAQAPYQSLYVSTSTNLTTRHLFQYATTIAPLPISEYEIANTYANSILNLNLAGNTSSAAKAQLASFEQNITSNVAAGDTALATVNQDPPAPQYALGAQLVRAVVLGKMQQIGDTSLGSADQAFSTLLTSYASQKIVSDGTARLQYAYFLANVYGNSRASDIQTILAPIYQDTAQYSALDLILKAYIGAPSSRTKQNLALVSTIDPQFKAFLVSLGWTSADLSTQ